MYLTVFYRYENTVPMHSSELKMILGELGISKADFSRLLGLTPRAVALWMADERSIPGPVDAYLRLLRLLPLNLRQVELNRLKQKGTAMRDGMFGITFHWSTECGCGPAHLRQWADLRHR